jgi:hypothetical protein
MIDLEFLTTVPATVDICTRYWQLSSDGKFKESSDTLLPFGAIYHLPALEFVVFRNVKARDLRRRCPVCGMPPTLRTRQEALAPITPRPPCDDCVYLNRHLPIAGSTAASGADTQDASTPSISGMALIDCLSWILGPKLLSGFAVRHCTDLAPAHIGRFLSALSSTGVLEKAVLSESEAQPGAAVAYRLAPNSKYQPEHNAFTSMVRDGKSFDPDNLRGLWLYYAVAECVAYLCTQSSLNGLLTDPDDERLCSVLRSAVAVHGISTVWAISSIAVRKAVVSFEHGSSTRIATALFADEIERQCQSFSKNPVDVQPLLRPAGLARGQLGAWFYRWFGVDEHTSGTAVAQAFWTAAGM